jgi:hypothetical protein
MNMALMTVVNQKAYTINDYDTYLGYVGVPGTPAVGGAKKYPLPFPFEHVVLGPNGGGADSKQLPVCPRDFRKASQHQHVPLQHGEEWNQLVQDGTVTVAFAGQADIRDVEHVLIV